MNNVIILFLKENLQRLFTKSPLFFQIWTIISVILVAITGLPDLIAWLSDGGIIIPALWDEKIMVAVAWASRAALIMSLLTTQSTPVMEFGEVYKQTDQKALPFTAAAEKKIAVG
jgi:hypothetical protein